MRARAGPQALPCLDTGLDQVQVLQEGLVCWEQTDWGEWREGGRGRGQPRTAGGLCERAVVVTGEAPAPLRAAPAPPCPISPARAQCVPHLGATGKAMNC